MGYQRPTTPFLDSLANDSLVVPAAIVAGSPTYYSLPGIIASRFPLALGRDVIGLAPDEPTLATALKSAGYVTACFSAGNPYISARFGYERGFDVFHDFLQGGINTTVQADAPSSRRGWNSRIKRGLQRVRPRKGLLGRKWDDLHFEYCQRVTPAPNSLDELRRFPSADEVVDHAIDWLGSIGDVPFFLWLHLMDPHAPYYPKPEALSALSHECMQPYRARYLNSYWNRSDVGPRRLIRYREDVITLYDAGVRWVDAQLSRLVQSLRGSQRWSDCVFSLTADHGEEFLDHSGRHHPPLQLAEELIHVPLLLRLPGERKYTKRNSPFSLIHLAPTLLEIMGVPSPPQFKGESQLESFLSGSQEDEIAVSECVAGCTNPFHPQNRSGPRILSVRGKRFKMVFHFQAGTDFLYDLESDPAEKSPVGQDHEKPVRRHLLEIALKHLQSTEQLDSRARMSARLREISPVSFEQSKQLSQA